MHCYVPSFAWSHDRLILDPEESHHLVHVLRAEIGRRVLIFNGQGTEAEAEVLSIGRHRVELKLIQQRQVPRPAVALTLIQAVPREQKMDVVLQKATELGIAEIRPVVSDHGVVRLRDGDDAKRERWEKIVLNAAKQCGAAWLPQVHAVRNLLDALKDLPRFDLILTCSLEPDALPLRDLIASAKPASPRTVAFLVGPEGDFSARELAAARQAGARPVSLGARVLRAETAALYALSVLKYEFEV